MSDSPLGSSDANTATAPARTKLVFLYSDEDEEDNGNSSGATVEMTTLVAGVRTAIRVSDAPALHPETMAELQADAAASAAAEAELAAAEEVERAALLPPLPALPDLSAFAEDLVGAAPAAAIPVAGSGGMRVKVVEAHGLMEPGAVAAAAAAAAAAALRTRMTVEDLRLRSRLGGRRRFRDDGGEVDPEAPLEVEGEEEREEEIAIVGADGTVRAVRSHGYALSVDERDFLHSGPPGEEEEGSDENAEDEADAMEGAVDEAMGGAVAVGGASRRPDAALTDALFASTIDAIAGDAQLATEDGEEGDVAYDGGGDFDDFDDEDDEEEDEEDEELDDLLFVAIVEQLVKCCEADDRDPEMDREAERFLAEARPELAALEAGTIDERTLFDRLDRSVRRFQRIFKAVYRPRDAPIMVGGVKMDM